MVRRNYFLFATCWALLAVAGVPRAAAQNIFPRIINGTPTDQFPSVGIVGDTTFGAFGSGTLISPFHVLTAAHVADIFRSRPETGIFMLDDQEYPVKRVFIHPDFNRQQLTNDIAVLELADPVLDIVPSEIFTGTPHVGDLLQIVGYGGGGDATGGDGSFGVKRVALTTIDAVSETQIIWTFDQTDEGNTAAGDSGGPGYLDTGGQLQIASITSGGTTENSELGDVSFNTRVDAFADWVNAILDSGIDTGDDTGQPGDQPPVVEPPPAEDNPPNGGHPPVAQPIEPPGSWHPPVHRPGPVRHPGPMHHPGPARRPGSWHHPSPSRHPGAFWLPVIIWHSGPARHSAMATHHVPAYGLGYAPVESRNRRPRPASAITMPRQSGPPVMNTVPAPTARVNRAPSRQTKTNTNSAPTRQSGFSIWKKRR